MHVRMHDNGTVEINNPMFLKEEGDEDHGSEPSLIFDSDKVQLLSTANFTLTLPSLKLDHFSRFHLFSALSFTLFLFSYSLTFYAQQIYHSLPFFLLSET